ncbi:hypothetical protein CR513_30442, partial [Mucuna pruriens]
MGHSPSNKGYKCLDSNRRLFISKDVLFNEHKFPHLPVVSSLTPAFAPSPSFPLGVLSFAPLPYAKDSPVQHATPNSSPPSSSVSLPSTASTTIDPQSTSAFASSSSSPSPKNLHPMQTHSKSGVLKPQLHPKLLVTIAEPSSNRPCPCLIGDRLCSLSLMHSGPIKLGPLFLCPLENQLSANGKILMGQSISTRLSWLPRVFTKDLAAIILKRFPLQLNLYSSCCTHSCTCSQVFGFVCNKCDPS